jgi:hypothetical protein
MLQPQQRTTSTNKVRRDVLGGKRGDGQKRNRRVRRANAATIHAGAHDDSLTSVAGLVPFGAFLKREDVDRELKSLFFGLKGGSGVVYPMEAQMRLLIDAAAVGEHRVFGLEALAGDPLFVKLAGGVIPSIDTVYRDLRRFDVDSNDALEEMMSRRGLKEVAELTAREIHIDIDSTVETVFGNQEGAAVGYNPRNHGRPSYHPILAVVAETGTCVGAVLRPGDFGFGENEASLIGYYAKRVIDNAPVGSIVTTRIDVAGDCAEILAALDDAGSFFVVKARLTKDLLGAITLVQKWKTVDEDAFGEPLVQVAELDLQREGWGKLGKSFRVVVVRRRDRDNGKQALLWDGLDFSAQAFITNNRIAAAEDVVAEYDGRAEVEPRIAELKGFGLAKVPSSDFEANHAAFLLKLLAFNLLRRYVRCCAPDLKPWGTQWIIQALLRVPGRLTTSAGQTSLHVRSDSAVAPLLN